MIRNRLKYLLKETDTSQRLLADAIGRSKTTINRIAKEDPNEFLEILEEICNYFGVGIADLLYIEQERKPLHDEQEDKPQEKG